MKILIIADVHGYNKDISKSFEEVKTNGVDLVICPGDFTDMFNIETGFTQENVAEMVLQKLLAYNKPLLCVPGNHDPYEILDVFEDYGVNLHNKTRKMGNHTFIGWGGAATPFRTMFEPTEEETEEALKRLGEGVDNKSIVVLHNPPKGIKLDSVPDGSHVGSEAARKFIEEKQPLLVISAHIHEQHGIDRIGNTTIFYPGPFFNGDYGIVEIENNRVSCRRLKTTLSTPDTNSSDNPSPPVS
jgi:Icc-related predicted phosphoesterase